MRTLATGAAALLIAAIVGVLALTGVSAQGPSDPADPDDLKKAQEDFVRMVDLADVDQDDTDQRTDGLITIGTDIDGADLPRALEWLAWMDTRPPGELTARDREVLESVRDAKAAMDKIQKDCSAVYGVCEWTALDAFAPIDEGLNTGPNTVRVQAVRVSATTWRVQVLEIGSGGGVKRGPEVTVEPTETASAVLGTAHRLKNDSLVAVVVDLKRDKRVEFAIVRDANGDGEFTRKDDGGAVVRPDNRFAPGNTRINDRPLLSSKVSIPDTVTEWSLQGDGS